MHQVMEAGINYIDSARGYTVSEEYIGYAIEGIRDQFVLATKSMARDKESMARDVDISLKNFRTDYIDLYQIHNPNASQLETVCAPGGALEALLEARAAGKIGHIGITLHSADVFRQALELDWVETVMFPYNIVETQAEELIAACAEKNIGFICMKPLAGGAIDDATLAMRFISHNSNVTVTIPGMAEKKELDENVAAFCDDTPLTQQEIEKINGIRKELGGNFCRRCGYCAPCSVGIGIPAALVAEGYHLRYNLKDYAMARYEASGAPASSCVDCGLCEERCPYHLPIRQMLKRVVSTFGK
jgi:predicted aldo/keto reductase-like oxidoreductase